MSEHSDAAVVIVSEQTGEISFAVNGEIHSNISLEELKNRLDQCLLRSPDTDGEDGLRAAVKNRIAAVRKKLAPVKEDENENHQEDRQ